ncbi:MAG TPA: hypothetical protein VGE74_02710 [Gemmata sp.]
MARTMRFLVPLAAVLVACSVANAQPVVAPAPHPALSELVREYKRLGLPFLPPNAELVRINIDRYTERHLEEEPREERYELAFRVRAAKPGERTRYLRVGFEGIGLEEWEYVEPAAVEEAEPTPAALRGVGWEPPGYNLSLAVQCKARGWSELADRLYSLDRARLAAEQEPQTVRGAVLDIAWAHWHGQLFDRGTNRRAVLQRLEALLADAPSFRKPDVERFMRDLKLTIAPTKSKPGSVEALIDGLTDYQGDPWTDPEPASYWQLAELGFDAVPALIEHLNDDRLARAWQQGVRLTHSWNTTVGHLCSRLLYDLSGRTIGGGYWEKRGDRLKPDEARKWFESAKEVGEEKWLLAHAVPTGDGGPIVNEDGRPEPHIVRAIGAKYPGRLPAVYRALLKKPVASGASGGALINPAALVTASKLPRPQKVSLLEEALASDNTDHRALALEELARLDHALLRKHLSGELKRLERSARLWGPTSAPMERIEKLVSLADQPACWDRLADIFRAMNADTRVAELWGFHLHGPPDRPDPHRREAIRFLVRFLDDRSVSTDEDGVPIVVCDTAATQLAGLLGFPVKRLTLTYWPAHDFTRGPFSRAFFRAVVWQAAARELAAGP